MQSHSLLDEYKSSLTSKFPENKDKKQPSCTDILSSKELNIAKEQLYSETIESTLNYPAIDRYSDPLHRNQIYCLHSFVPAPGARPDEQGFYGWMKCRGTFYTAEEANQRAEEIIRYVDSLHPITTSYCGRPFPLVKGKFIKDSIEINLNEKMKNDMGQALRAKKLQEQQAQKAVEERRKELLKVSVSEAENSLETYTTLRVKLATLQHTFAGGKKELHTLRNNIIKTREELEKLDEKDPSCKDQFLAQYNQAREEVGLQETPESMIYFMKNDVNLSLEQLDDELNPYIHMQLGSSDTS